MWRHTLAYSGFLVFQKLRACQTVLNGSVCLAICIALIRMPPLLACRAKKPTRRHPVSSPSQRSLREAGHQGPWLACHLHGPHRVRGRPEIWRLCNMNMADKSAMNVNVKTVKTVSRSQKLSRDTQTLKKQFKYLVPQIRLILVKEPDIKPTTSLIRLRFITLSSRWRFIQKSISLPFTWTRNIRSSATMKYPKALFQPVSFIRARSSKQRCCQMRLPLSLPTITQAA